MAVAESQLLRDAGRTAEAFTLMEAAAKRFPKNPDLLYDFALLAEKQPSQAFVTPQQLGELALFLCSSAAQQVRGAAWNIDGGWLAQ